MSTRRSSLSVMLRLAGNASSPARTGTRLVIAAPTSRPGSPSLKLSLQQASKNNSDTHTSPRRTSGDAPLSPPLNETPTRLRPRYLTWTLPLTRDVERERQADQRVAADLALDLPVAGLDRRGELGAELDRVRRHRHVGRRAQLDVVGQALLVDRDEDALERGEDGRLGMEVGVEPAERRHEVRAVAPARPQPAVAGHLEDGQEPAADGWWRRPPASGGRGRTRRPRRSGCRGCARSAGIFRRNEPSRITFCRRFPGPSSMITPTARRARYSSLSGDPAELHRQPEHVDVRRRREQRVEVAEQHRRVADRVLGEQHVADRTRRQPLAQGIGVGASVDADDAAGADPVDPVGDVHAGTERDPDDEHEGAVAVDGVGRSGQLVDAERRHRPAGEPVARPDGEA